MAGKTAAAAAREAERVRKQYWGEDRIPVDPAQVARGLGIEVVEAFLDADVAGAIELREGKPPKIYLSATDHPRRKRFTCAHEIGHFVKRGEQKGGFEYIDYRDGTASKGVDADERYANAFAAELLMPEPQVRELRSKGLSESDMAKKFGVSKAAMVNRLKNLDLYR